MKNINLINTVSPKKQKAVARWLWFTFSIWSIVFICLIVALTYKVVHIIRVYQRYNNALVSQHTPESVVQAIKTIQAEQELLDKRRAKIEHFAQQPMFFAHCLQELSNIIPDNVVLTSFKREKKEIILEGRGTNVQAIMHFFGRLKNSAYFNNAQLISLKALEHNNMLHEIMSFVIKAHIAKNIINK